MKRVTECTTGRVVLLKFHGVGRNYFYWLQEPKEDKDEDYLQKVRVHTPCSPSSLYTFDFYGCTFIDL